MTMMMHACQTTARSRVGQSEWSFKKISLYWQLDKVKFLKQILTREWSCLEKKT